MVVVIKKPLLMEKYLHLVLLTLYSEGILENFIAIYLKFGLGKSLFQGQLSSNTQRYLYLYKHWDTLHLKAT